MAYTIDALASHGLNLPPERPRQRVTIHVWNRFAAPRATRKVADSDTTYQPARQNVPSDRNLRNTSLEASKQLPLSAEETEAAHKAEMQRKNSTKLRAEYDAACARSQAIADAAKGAWNKQWGRK